MERRDFKRIVNENAYIDFFSLLVVVEYEIE
jgi:hypothetical protein